MDLIADVLPKILERREHRHQIEGLYDITEAVDVSQIRIDELRAVEQIVTDLMSVDVETGVEYDGRKTYDCDFHWQDRHAEEDFVDIMRSYGFVPLAY